MRWLRDGRLVIAILGALCATPLSAADRPRTPAEVELRRADIAEQLAMLAEEESRLRNECAADRPPPGCSASPDDRLQAIAVERAALTAEAFDLAAIVTRTSTGPVARADPQGLTTGQIGGATGQVTSGTAFNPAITVIPDGGYYYDNAPPRDAGAGVPPRGFSLREVELAFSGAVDPYFDVWAIFSIGEGEIETEEVYVQTRRFLPGTQVRFGQFFSGVGYLNRQHPHQWDFTDQALPFDAIFGGRLGEVGVQATWLPAFSFYTQFGFEALQGDNAFISQQLSDQYPALVEDTPGPRLLTGFVKVSPDLGYSNTLQAGASFGRSRSHHEAVATSLGEDVLAGTAWFAGTDIVWGHDSPRPFGEGDLKIQGEYVYRSKALAPVGAPDLGESRSRQDGVYAQAVYGIAPRWTVGGRFDASGLRNEIENMAQTVEGASSTRYTANLTFNPTEFSRLRVQYNYGRVPREEGSDGKVGFHQVYVQLQMSLGVHGAHTF